MTQNKVYSRKELAEIFRQRILTQGRGFLGVIDIENSDYALFTIVNNFQNTHGQDGVGTLFDDSGELYDANPEGKYYVHSFVPIKPE